MEFYLVLNNHVDWQVSGGSCIGTRLGGRHLQRLLRVTIDDRCRSWVRFAGVVATGCLLLAQGCGS